MKKAIYIYITLGPDKGMQWNNIFLWTEKEATLPSLFIKNRQQFYTIHNVLCLFVLYHPLLFQGNYKCNGAMDDFPDFVENETISNSTAEGYYSNFLTTVTPVIFTYLFL